MGLQKRFLSLLKRVIVERKIIIISHDKVLNIPIGTRLQWSAIAAAFAAFVWSAYSTGIYIAYQEVIGSNNGDIQKVFHKNKILEEQYAILQHDLSQIAKHKGEKSGYDDLLIDQYLDEGNSAQLGSDKPLIERIDFLEKELAKLESYKRDFLTTLQDRTDTRIEQLEDIIGMTGLKLADLEKSYGGSLQLNLGASEQDGDDSHQGGPYLELPEDMKSEKEQTVANDVAHLVSLYHIFRRVPLAIPIEEGRITSHFGKRTDPITRRAAVHYGMDFAGPVGAKIYSTADGVVTFAGRQGAYGRMVEIDHGMGLMTRYGHLRKIKVRKGQEVSLGSVIGIEGNSGRSTGTHLHYEVHYNDKAVNPNTFVKAGQNVF